MTTEDAFYQTLEADPADVVTRLVYADWLEDQDPPRRVEANGQRWQVRNQQWPRLNGHWIWWKFLGSYQGHELESPFFECILPCDVFEALGPSDRPRSTVEGFPTLRDAETALARALDELEL